MPKLQLFFTKRFWETRKADIPGTVVAVLGMLIGPMFAWHFVAAEVAPKSSFFSYTRHLALYVWFVSIVHYYKLLTVDASVRGRYLPATLLPGWKYCYLCECNTPPRSFHCWRCRTCILKREHHCGFAAVCVGYQNHVHFIGYCLTIALACGYGLLAFIMHTIWSGDSLFSIMLIFAPIPAKMLGWGGLLKSPEWLTNTFTFFGALFFFGTVFPLVQLAFQIIMLQHGQVSHERDKHVIMYDQGWKGNIRSVLGSRPLVALFFPFLTPTLPSDGFYTDDVTMSSYGRPI